MIKTKEILNSEKFVREPVEDLCDEIENNSSKKIILTGGRGIGKSIVLQNYQIKSLNTRDKLIYTSFDAIGSDNELFNEQFLTHYYELIFSRKILNYIKRNYSLTYEKNFKDLELLINNLLKQTVEYINNFIYTDVPIEKFLASKELSSEIIEATKKYLSIDSLSIAIDRFDWTNNGDPLTQNILSRYFDMFDKIIITTDDESLTDEKDREDILQKNYSFIDINYGYSKDIIREIFRKRINEYNKDPRNRIFETEIITEEIYQNLINKTNGNISLMLDIIKEIIGLWQWEDGIDNIEKSFDSTIEDQLKHNQKIKEMSSPIKLHL